MPQGEVKKTVKKLNPQPEPPSEDKLKSKKADAGSKGIYIPPKQEKQKADTIELHIFNKPSQLA